MGLRSILSIWLQNCGSIFSKMWQIMLYKIIATVDPSFYYAAFNSSFALRLLWKLWTEKVNFYIHLIALFALLDTTTRNYHWDCP
jgi:hypothetical protein